MAPLEKRLSGLAAQLVARQGAQQPAITVPGSSAATAAAPAPAFSISEDGVETVHGKGITINFNSKRCIHSRFCVLWQPQVYKAK